MSKRKTKEEFIKEAKKVHGEFYCYKNVVYIMNKSKVIINCKIHGRYEQTPNSHLSGHGCPACAHNSISEDRPTISAASDVLIVVNLKVKKISYYFSKQIIFSLSGKKSFLIVKESSRYLSTSISRNITLALSTTESFITNDTQKLLKEHIN